MKQPIQLSACVVIAVGLIACRTQCKIEPPPNVIGTSKEIQAKAAANALSTAISGGELSGQYQNTVNNTYQTVRQDDVAFYLLLQAYNCESARGNAAGASPVRAAQPRRSGTGQARLPIGGRHCRPTDIEAVNRTT